MNTIPKLAAIAAVPFLAASLAAQRQFEVEPNDSVLQAQAIAAGQHMVANLTPGDQDWFSFTLAAAAEIHLATSGNYTVNPSVDTVVFLYDAAGTTRLAWNDNQRGNHSDCGVNLPAGSYTCLVTGKLATTTGAYGLDFIVLPPAIVTATEGAEPNGDPGVAGNVPTPIVLGGTFTGELATSADTDWFTFTLAGRAVVQAIVYDDGGVPQLDTTTIRFYSEISPGMFAPTGTSSSLTTSHRALNLGHTTTLPAGNYAIEIAVGSAAAGTAPLYYNRVGKYGVRTALVDMPGTNTVIEAPEPNDTPATAAPLVLGDTAVGFCSGSNEADWYQIVVTAPTTIAVMSDNGTPAPITDTTVGLYDINGTFITSASSGGPSSHGRLIYTIPQGGIYYISVAGGLFAATGDYVLYTGGTSPMTVSSSFQQQPPSTNACPGSNGLRPAITVASSEVPQLGSTFVMRLQNALPNAVLLPFYGLSKTLANGGLVVLPFDMTVLGAPGCFIRVDPAVSTFAVADGTGVTSIDIPMPGTLSLRGLPIFLQAACLDLPNNPLGLSMTNDVRLLVGDRGF
jgi:hypothetical protein